MTIRARLNDVAREAGVSTATVDRVIDKRAGVRGPTAARVEAAIRKLGYRPDPFACRLGRGRAFRFCFLLPIGANPFMTNLGTQAKHVANWLDTQRASVDTLHVDVFDAETLAGVREARAGEYDGVAVVALDHPRVRGAIDDLVEHGVAVVTLVSDAPSSRRLRYVGIDNVAAGRTAGSLVGRFVGDGEGAVGVIAGSLGLRDHAERYFGFQQIMTEEFPHLKVLPVRENRDDDETGRRAAAGILAENKKLAALYSIGSGNAGLAAALEASGRAGDVVFVGHELTADSRRLLMRNIMDAVINQNPGHEVRSAARILLAHCSGEPIIADQNHILIDIFVRENVP
ncbi:MAG TPA: LacI family DNA-binding transcriptional regulator [Roseiarcus sp.]|jgi:LacI family transcriptional regulator|nr:LacI family DNA-binding transcriptional regulator [Roseiarcus sp.]